MGFMTLLTPLMALLVRMCLTHLRVKTAWRRDVMTTYMTASALSISKERSSPKIRKSVHQPSQCILPALSCLLTIATATATPIDDTPSSSHIQTRALILHDRIRDAAPAGEPYDFIEHYTGDAATTGERIKLNPDALLLMSNDTSATDSGTLQKRSGTRAFYAFAREGCENYLGGVANFVCAKPTPICFDWAGKARSVRITQTAPNAAPYPVLLYHALPLCADKLGAGSTEIMAANVCEGPAKYSTTVTEWGSVEFYYAC
ncbi:hypothetical protein B0T17DRAFT_599462 [Bombardia bombarda]|uniref:Uncharacterized protein n=1 Tax=Bombardia bombarda TaxID=252184 RepID=A0AA39X0W0_9PEZI|nr:hypothetical protein B0T17DRAFT_599462 [Bombardia bombarda]